MNYTGQNCPGCGKAFTAQDDVVVCPVCGTPQHRECWENNGECANAEKHSSGYSWEPEHAEQAEASQTDYTVESEGTKEAVRCPNCGHDNPDYALTCINCGAPLSSGAAQNPFGAFFSANGEPVNPFLYGVPYEPDSEIEGAKVKDIASFVQRNSSKYIPKFKKLSEKKSKVSFNWAAFFFSPYWFFFRRMWKIGLLFAGLMIAISLPFTGVATDIMEIYNSMLEMISSGAAQAEIEAVSQQFISASAGLAPMMALSFVFRLLSGFIANPLYKKHVISSVKNLRVSLDSDRAFESMALRKGGSSIFIAFASYFGYTVVNDLLITLANFLIK